MSKQSFDIEKLSVFSGIDDLEGLFVLLNAFRKDVPSIVVEMDTALQQNDFASLKTLAHGAKGVSVSFTAETLVFLMKKLEDAAKEKNTEQCKELFQQIFLETQSVFRILHSYLIEHELYKKLPLFDGRYMLIDSDKGSQITTIKHLQKIGIEQLDIVSTTEKALTMLNNNLETNHTIIVSDSITDSEAIEFIEAVRLCKNGTNQNHQIIRGINDATTSFSPFIRLDVNAIIQPPIKRSELLRTILELDVLKISSENWLQDQKQYERISFEKVEPKSNAENHMDIRKIQLNDTLKDDLYIENQMIVEKDTLITMNRHRLITELERLNNK